MRFPGSKLLSQDLSTETTPLESVIRQCEDVNLSGYSARVFQSEFSSNIWKARHETQRARSSRLHEILEQQRPQETSESAPPPEPAADPKAAKPKPKVVDRKPLQQRVLASIREQTSSMLATFSSTSIPKRSS